MNSLCKLLKPFHLNKAISLLFFFLLAICSARAQTEARRPKIAIHVSNPITSFIKTGLKLEYRNKQMGYLLMGKIYYGGPPKYPGEKVGVAVRYYFENAAKKHENFLYGKLVGGHLQYFPGSGSGFTRSQEVPESNYYGVGAGWGRHFNFNYFFIEINAGLKYVIPDVAQDVAFYATGPGSILDLNFNLGLQF